MEHREILTRPLTWRKSGKKGNIQLQALSNGTDLLAKYKEATPGKNSQIDTTPSPEEWMKKLLSSEDSGVGMSSGDPIMELVTTLFTLLMALAMQIDGKSEEEKMQAATDSAIKKQVDLSTLMPSLKECSLSIQENWKSSSTNVSTERIVITMN